MDTRMLGYEQAATVTEIAAWANERVGKEVPGSPELWVARIIDFQVLSREARYDAIILVEVSERHNENEISLKAEDIAVIEEITSTVDDTV